MNRQIKATHPYSKYFVLCAARHGTPRYQAVYTDVTQPSFDHAQSVCEIFGTGLGTVLDQLDFDALNTTLNSINAQDVCGERLFLGAKSPGNRVWSWRTGEPTSNVRASPSQMTGSTGIRTNPEKSDKLA